jgi:hypothetical protein
MGLQAGTGWSRASASATAGREAACDALAGLRGAAPALVVVYASVRYDLRRLLDAVREVTGDAPLVGASSDGAFAQGTHLPPGTGVAVLALTAGRYRFGTAAVTGIGADLDAAGRALARAARAAVPGNTGPHAALLLLSDGLSGDQQRLVHGAYRVTGAQVALVGGSAGDDRRMRATSVFHGGVPLPDAAVGVWIAADAPLRVVATHGWSPSGPPLLVTRADGPIVREIDGRPAARAYAEELRRDAEACAAEPGRRFPLRRLRPLGLLQPDGSYVIRSVQTTVERPEIGADELVAFGHVPPGAAVQIMRGSRQTLLEASRRLAATALEGHDDPGVVLAFSCALHQDIHGERAWEEARHLQAAAGAVPTFGVHTYGEVARTVGVLGFHNATMTGLAL